MTAEAEELGGGFLWTGSRFRAGLEAQFEHDPTSFQQASRLQENSVACECYEHKMYAEDVRRERNHMRRQHSAGHSLGKAKRLIMSRCATSRRIKRKESNHVTSHHVVRHHVNVSLEVGCGGEALDAADTLYIYIYIYIYIHTHIIIIIIICLFYPTR